jgi:hypothetical protein
MLNPIDNPRAYDSFTLGGVLCPGQVVFSGHDRKYDVDVKAAPKQRGGTYTLTAIPPVQFTATVTLMRDSTVGIDDYANWPSFQKLLESTISGAAKRGLDIVHPALNAIGIKSVILGTLGGQTETGYGQSQIVLSLIEYDDAKKISGGTVSGSVGGSNRSTVDPNQDLQDQIKLLREQYKVTP